MTGQGFYRFLLAGILALAPALPTLADVAVRLGYETRGVGEIEPCG